MTALPSLLLIVMPLTSQEVPRPEQVEWLRKHAVPLHTVEAGNGFEDLAAFREMVGDARVVALGESTHGSREQFQLKHRIIEYLVSEMGFNTFSIEASMPESYRVDDFVSRGEGDPVELITGMYFWTWRTEEVLAMVEWMRAFNERNAPGAERSVRFTGFDMQTPDLAARIVVENLAGVDPDLSEALREHYDEMVDARPRVQGWMSSTAALDPSLVAGRKIVFSAKLRSEDVTYVAIWFRTDLAGESVAFLNSAEQHEASEGWVVHEIELDIPTEIDNALFGLIHSGGGTGWFDDLNLLVDGEPVQPAGFDFAMETEDHGFPVMSREYRGRLDKDVAAVGEASLRIDCVAPSASATGMDTEDAHLAARDIHAELAEMEAELTAELGAEDARWTIQMARVVEQCMESRSGRGAVVRDRSMAENVRWILDQDPDAKLILWAHNGHVANDTIWMGGHLERELGDDYLPVGFATSRGEYRAVSRGDSGGPSNHALQAAPEGSIESFFEAAGLSLAMLDLSEAEAGSPESGWLTEPRAMRSIGALEMNQQFYPATAFPKFEVLLYVAETTGAWPLRKSWSEPPSDED